MNRKTASVIIDNYNYARFLGTAIESALGQSYPSVEVIVVDDGSTDHSRDVIARYRDQVIAVHKENGGMGSAFNEGYRRCRGDVIFFLDSDDILVPTAVERAVGAFTDADVVQVHWPLWKVDEDGRRTGDLIPSEPLPEGDLREHIIAHGPASYVSSPTTGNAWSRGLLQQVFPMPEAEYRRIGETYLVTLAGIYGRVRAMSEPLGCYRVHGTN
jgi:glycosyltransferase involved in cell wall biosynthesis